ncbi:MAG: signal peptidase I [Candidatus Aenigmarchaeota archaeon]|nr:signal peptidase I [Candidatus Aenigmarchaeota archaeon]
MAERKKKSDNILRDVAETAAYAVLGVFMAILIYHGLILLLGTSRPVIDVVSESMSPSINRGDLVIVKHAEPQDIKVGDVIVFDTLSQPLPVIHRLYKINDDGTFQTLGDNNGGVQHDWEKQIESKDIVGRAVFVIPYLGWIKIIICDSVPAICNVLAPTVYKAG